MSGPNQNILARIRGSKDFMEFDDRAIPELTRVEGAQPMYQSIATRGIIKADEQMAKRAIAARGKVDLTFWNKFYETGTVFTHAGFDDQFETFEHFNLPNTEKKPANEVILARSYYKPVLVEFAPRDMWHMGLSSTKPRYTRREGHITYMPRLSIG